VTRPLKVWVIRLLRGRIDNEDVSLGGILDNRREAGMCRRLGFVIDETEDGSESVVVNSSIFPELKRLKLLDTVIINMKEMYRQV
jgi:hypothetical protein